MPRVENCKSCGARVYWALSDPKPHSTTGKQPEPVLMPVDEDPTPDGNLCLVFRTVKGQTRLVATPWDARRHAQEKRRKSHFATCPQADDWRKRQLSLEMPDAE